MFQKKTLFMHFTVSINCFMILQLENHENHIGWKWKEIMCLNSYSITWILQQVSNTLLRYDKNLLINKQIILWKGNQKPSKWKISYKITWPSMSFMNLSQNTRYYNSFHGVWNNVQQKKLIHLVSIDYLKISNVLFIST